MYSVAAAVLFLFAVASPDNPVQVVGVKSQPGCPLELKGSVRLPANEADRRDFSFVARMSATNLSTKKMLLVVYRVEIATAVPDGDTGKVVYSPSRAETSIRDFFFSPTALASGQILDSEAKLPPFASDSTSDSDSPRIIPSAEVLYIQFDDGSFWGQPESAAETLRDRELTVGKLEQLAARYREFGELSVVGDLSLPSGLIAVNILQQIYNGNRRNIPAVMKRLEEMLSSAHMHASQIAHRSH